MAKETYLILGGAGLVGLQVARRIANDLSPRKIIIASLYKEEVEEAIEDLKKMFSTEDILFEGVWGDIFVREAFSHQSRKSLLESAQSREALYEDLFGPLKETLPGSTIAQVIREHRPDVIVDSINTATAISYQDIYTTTVVAKQELEHWTSSLETSQNQLSRDEFAACQGAFEALLLSQPIPQLIRHVLLLNAAMREAGTRLYLKIGTTGTGGMGLNVPYTHSEDKPSAKLMTKTAVAFAHTGLLFLMARTPGGPIVKEIKPGAMIGYSEIASRVIRERGQPVHVFSSETETLSGKLELRMSKNHFDNLGELQLPVVNTGENGLFTRGEFEAITSLRQMEFMTPEDIALEAMLEIMGSNSGRDVIAAVDGAVMYPTYRAGYLRQRALDEIERLEKKTGTHSVALGQLGPPELSKLLWECELLRILYHTLEEALKHSPAEISTAMERLVKENGNLRHTITSIGVPILTQNGDELIRGPFIRIPEVPGTNYVDLDSEMIETCAEKGWVDLRPANMRSWHKRFETLEASRKSLRGSGSAAVIREAYLFKDIRSGSIVGWIFNNEQEGYRVK